MDIAWIRSKAVDVYIISAHAREECAEEEISLADVREVLLKGEILEQYAHRRDIRGDSCLMLGHGHEGQAVHIVVARVSDDVLRVVTAYIPRLPDWITEKKRGA